MLFLIFPRGGAGIGLEHPRKMAGGGKPQIRTDGGQGLVRKTEEAFLICTPFTGHPVEGVLLCGTHMSTKGNV